MKCNKTSVFFVVSVVIVAALCLGNVGSSRVSGQEGAGLPDDSVDYEDWYEEEEDVEAFEELELEVAEAEAQSVRISHLADIVTDEVRSSAFAIEILLDTSEPEVAVRVLSDSLQQAKKPAIRRVIRLALIELYGENDRPDDATEIAREIISGNS